MNWTSLQLSGTKLCIYYYCPPLRHSPFDLKLFGFPIFRFSANLMKVIEHTWWRLLSIPDEGYWAYLMKVIEHTWWRLLSVPDEGYSSNALCALNLISTFSYLRSIIFCFVKLFYILFLLSIYRLLTCICLTTETFE
jgi:hypothetical protein